MNMNTTKITEWAESRETSYVIAAAILGQASDEASAQRIWSSPAQSEVEQIMDIAWVHADVDIHELYWGETTMTDEGHAR